MLIRPTIYKKEGKRRKMKLIPNSISKVFEILQLQRPHFFDFRRFFKTATELEGLISN